MKCLLFSQKLERGMSWCPNEGAAMGCINGVINPILFSEGCAWGIGVQQGLGHGDVILISPYLNSAPLGEAGENLLHLLLVKITGWKEIFFLSIWSLPADVFTLFNMFSPSLQPNNGILKAIWYHRFPSRVLLASVGSSALKINGIIGFKVIKREKRDKEFSSCVPHDIGKRH